MEIVSDLWSRQPPTCYFRRSFSQTKFKIVCAPLPPDRVCIPSCHLPSFHLRSASPRNDRTLFDSDLYENKGTRFPSPLHTENRIPTFGATTRRSSNRYLLLACAPFIRTVYDVLRPPVKERQSNERREPRDKLPRSLWNQISSSGIQLLKSNSNLPV